ncbi:MAG TPA: FkbM family methyltransferase [Pseudolabrys sp.]|nr:FkbM family methyltransferase [Pseudolabrys sp.]
MSLTLEQYERLNPRCEIVHKGVRMVFVTPSATAKGRVDTIYEKEPCTLEWIEGFASEDLLFDVGANVGMYTIWAAATRGCRVIAFEPEAQNYALLNRNIQANALQDRVKAYCIGLSDTGGLFDLNIADLRIGGSNHALGEALDFKHEPMQVAYRQGCAAFTLDHLIAQQAVPIPNHIKIDVDGIEPKIVAGAGQLLGNPSLRSLLIETNLNLDDHRAMVDRLAAAGFKADPDQVRRAMRQAGPFKGVAEHVFRR